MTLPAKKPPVVVHIDRNLPIEDFARVMRTLGYELRTAMDGSLLVVRHRVRKVAGSSAATAIRPAGQVEGLGE